MHPFMTAELVREHRARLTVEADQRRFTRPLRHRRNPTNRANRFGAVTLLLTRRIPRTGP